jgi:hypothetical protein
MTSIDPSQNASPDIEPERGAYLQSLADTSPHKVAQQRLAMPGPRMSAEHQMPSREMNEPATSSTQVGGDMPRPKMT